MFQRHLLVDSNIVYIFIIVIISSLAIEVCWALVFVRFSILSIVSLGTRSLRQDMGHT